MPPRILSPEAQLAGFIARYSPEIVSLAGVILNRMRALLPGAMELVYDNYNALVVGFGPSERPSEAVFSVVLYPRWITLFFLEGVQLKDPHHVLKGSGKVVRHIVLDSVSTLDDPPVRELMTQAIQLASPPFDPAAPRRLVIRSISKKQRPRRPLEPRRG